MLLHYGLSDCVCWLLGANYYVHKGRKANSIFMLYIRNYIPFKFKFELVKGVLKSIIFSLKENPTKMKNDLILEQSCLILIQRYG